MGVVSLFLIAVGLSMDAFAVSICKGLSLRGLKWKHALTVGLYFGIFQALMPVVGYYIANTFSDLVIDYDHWIAFVLLAFIGGKMIYESFKGGTEQADGCLRPTRMLPLAIATSIDALAVGVTFALQEVHIFFAAALIGATTLLFSMLGVKLGNVFGVRYKSKAELLGGLILTLMGFKILLEHLGVLNF